MDPTALGRYLRESREARELTLEDAVRALRIRRDILEAFEQGEFNIMDSTVRIRGMLRNYAHFLGLDEERVLQYYETSVNSKRRRRLGRRETHADPIAARRITDTPPSLPKVILPRQDNRSRIVSILRNGAILLISFIALAVIVFVLIDTLQLNQVDEVNPVLPTLASGTLTITPTNTATITPRATIPTDTPDAASLNIVGIQVILEIQQRSWLRILVDDIETYTGILEPGFSATYTGNEQVAITAANAAALEITYNGVIQNAFGARGQEVELLFTSTGINVIHGDGQNNSTATPIPTISEQINVATESPALITAEVLTSLTPDNLEGQISTTAPIAGIVTPTPLFPLVASTESSIPESTVIISASASQPVNTSAPVATVSPQATITIEPTITDTATSSAILPHRETPSNPTATKTG